jgi:formylglycine-generating enzyme required for sulfatase activity
LRQWNVDLPVVAEAEAEDRAGLGVPRATHHGRIRRSRARPPQASVAADHDSWRVNKLGQLMVRVILPEEKSAELTAHEITMGDYAAYVRSRADHYGSEHRRLSWIREPIKRHFNEIAGLQREAAPTAANPEDALTDQQLQLPVRHISALQAVAFCVWVSQEEGVTEDQLAFRVRDGLQKEGESVLEVLERKLLQNSSPLQSCARNARGYRLPFSDEWEFRFAEPEFTNLSDDRLRDQFGWFRGNSQLEILPIGGKRPHRLGVFDVWGNVTEWCIASLDETHVEFEALGSSYESPLGKMRPITPGYEVFGGHRTIGFRMIRTLD